MTRRTALLAAASAAVAATLPACPPDDLRALYRRDGQEWSRVRMYELRPGDLFRFDPEDVPDVWKVTVTPFKDKKGVWAIQAEHFPVAADA